MKTGSDGADAQADISLRRAHIQSLGKACPVQISFIASTSMQIGHGLKACKDLG